MAEPGGIGVGVDDRVDDRVDDGTTGCPPTDWPVRALST
jgi:hypothetical protein